MSFPPLAPQRTERLAERHTDSDKALGIRSLGDDQALTWFVQLNRTSVTDTQRMAFNRWLGLDPANRRSYQAVLTLWQRLGPQSPNITLS